MAGPGLGHPGFYLGTAAVVPPLGLAVALYLRRRKSSRKPITQ